MSTVPIFEKGGAGSHIAQRMIFQQLWLLGNKKSYISGLFLRDFMNSPYFLNCFAHVLAKRMNAYPHFKFYAGNIVLLKPEEHFLWDQGTEEARISYALKVEEESKGKNTADWNKLKTRAEELKQLYNKKFPTRRGLIINYHYSPAEVMAIVGTLNEKFWKELTTKKP